jgi:hypothetical protein
LRPDAKPEEIAVYRVLPKVISVLGYSKGFGLTDLVAVWSRKPPIKSTAAKRNY